MEYIVKNLSQQMIRDFDHMVELLLSDDGGINANPKGTNNHVYTVNSRQSSIFQISIDQPHVLFGRDPVNDSKDSGFLV